MTMSWAKNTDSTSVACPPAPSSAAMSEHSDSIRHDKMHQLFDQEDSGLGSMNFLSSRGLDSLDFSESDESNFNNAGHQRQSQKDLCKRNCSPNLNSLSSLTYGLSNLNLALSGTEAYRGSDTNTREACTPDNARLNALQNAYEISHAKSAINESCTSMLRDDSGLFSFNASSASTDLQETISSEGSINVAKAPEFVKDSVVEEQSNATDSLLVTGSTSYASEPDHRQTMVEVSAEQRVALYQGDADGDNWLHLTIINGREDLATTVIRLAPDYTWLSFSNLLRQTPLHLAVLTSQPRLVRRLVCAGAMVEAQDQRGDTPLHVACRHGQTASVACLLQPVSYEETMGNTWEIPYQRLPQDMSVTNGDGQTPLHVAVACGHISVIRLLLEAGADPNQGEAKSGRTAIHMAADKGMLDLVQILASSNNADLSRGDYAGYNAAQIARGRGLEDIYNFLHTDDHSSDDSLDLSDSEMTLVDSDSDSETREEVMQ